MPDRRPELVRVLIKRTIDGTLNWQNGPAADTFMAALERGRVVISKVTRNDVYDVVFRIYNSEGELAESFSDVDLQQIVQDIDWYQMTDRLYSDARRSATGSDELISDLISELNGDMPF